MFVDYICKLVSCGIEKVQKTHVRNKTQQRTLFILILFIQLLKYFDLNPETGFLGYQECIIYQSGFLIVSVWFFKSIFRKIGLIILALVILGEHMYFQNQKITQSRSFWQLCILAYLIILFNFDPFTKRSFNLNLQLLEPEFHKYATNPEQLIIQQMKSIQVFQKISTQYLKGFFTELNASYNQIPYHNLTHGFDVANSMKRFLKDFQLINKVCEDQTDYICCLIAAYAHDAGHLGYTNSFYINTDHKLACDYAYQSPLQRMHCNILMNLLRKYDGIVPKKNKKWMIKMIIATDNMINNEQHALLHRKKDVLKTKFLCQEDKILLKEVLIHAADLTAPTREFQIANKWGQKLFEQFNAQRKLLIKNGLAENKNEPYSVRIQGQINFFGAMVLPLFKELAQICLNFQRMLETAQKNQAKWKQILQKQQKNKLQ